jgi:hypothetical protein
MKPIVPEYDNAWRTRLTIFNDDVHVSFHIRRDGSGAGKIVVIQTTDAFATAVFLTSERQQNYYANEVNYRLLASEGAPEASFEGVVAWLDSQSTLQREA